jgi:hypothetical protein
MLMGDEVPPRENLLRKTLFTQILMPNGLIRINLTRNTYIKMKVTIVGAGNVGATCADVISYRELQVK